MFTSDKIKTVRAKMGDDQATFAKRIGVHQATISRWERGRLPGHPLARTTIERLLSEIEFAIPMVEVAKK